MAVNEQEELELIEGFANNFRTGYDSSLRFQLTTFNKTINNFLKCSINERRLLAIYLHENYRIAVDLFARRIAENNITEYLNERFILWGFDCSSDRNAEYMQKLLRENLINYDLSRANNMGVLLIVGRFYGINEIMCRITLNTADVNIELENIYNEFLRRNEENANYLDFLRQVSFSEYHRLSNLDGQTSPDNLNNDRILENQNNFLMGDVMNEQEEEENIRSFGIKFNQKFLSRLKFQATTFKQTLKEDKGFVTVYLHNDFDTNGFRFAERITQAQIAGHLNENFILYGFDCTSDNKKNYIQQLLNENSIDYDLGKPGSLPVLLLVRRCDRIYEILGKITAETEDILAELENSYSEFLRKNNLDQSNNSDSVSLINLPKSF